jgi:site-specific DNA recombinase
MLRAVGYARVSTEDQALTGVSLPVQREKLNAYASLYELELVSIEEDEGVSAKTLDRPALTRAMAMIDRGEADGLLIAKLDRLSRSVRDWDMLISRYFGEKGGKQLWSVSDAIDTRTAAGRLVLNVLMSVAQWEREAIAERTRDSLQHKIRTRARTGGILYGSSIDPADPRRSKKLNLPVGLIDNPEEVAVIAMIKAFRAEGRSLRKIASTLTELGIPTKKGGAEWSRSSVQRILDRSA